MVMNTEPGKGIGGRIRLFVEQSRRVLLVATKPDREEFSLSSKITGVGIAIIGIIGFAIFMVFQVLGLS